MVVYNLYLVCVSFAPGEADAPLIVDANTVLPIPVAREGLQAVTRWHSQIVQVFGVVDDHQLHLCPSLYVLRESSDALSFRDSLGIPIPVAPDHGTLIV